MRAIFVVVAFLGIFVVGHLSAQESEALGKLVFQHEVKLAAIEKPLAKIDDAYEAKLEMLRKQVAKAGNLDGVLAIKKEIDEFRSGGSGGDKPEVLLEARTAYLQQRAEARVLLKADVATLKESHREELLAFGRKAHEAGKAELVDQVKAAIAQLDKPLDAAPAAGQLATAPAEASLENWSGTGKFHVMADDRASFYINGEKVHRGGLGRSVGESFALKVGDRLCISLTNYDGGKQFKAAFASDDGEVIMSLRAADFRDVYGLVDKERDFDDALLAEGRLAHVAKKRWGSDTPLKVRNESDWIWAGDGNRAVLIGVVKASMFSRTEDLPLVPAEED